MSGETGSDKKIQNFNNVFSKLEQKMGVGQRGFVTPGILPVEKKYSKYIETVGEK